MEKQKFLVIDFETRSKADLKKCGAVEYADHYSTQIICAAYRLGTRKELHHQLINKKPATLGLCIDRSLPSLSEIRDALDNKNIIIIAHNVAFEKSILEFNLLISIPPERFICTASLAASLALPRSLEGACLALNLPIKKDMEGRRLMLKYSKPRRPTKADPLSVWHKNTRELERIYQYCQSDVDAETWLFLKLPPLNPKERKIWCLDQKINFRGFNVDRQLIGTTLKLIECETEVLNKETKEITDGFLDTTQQRNKTLEWLSQFGTDLKDLASKTVSEKLAEIHPNPTTLTFKDIKRILEIRQAISKTSTAKYKAFDLRSQTDGRVRDNLVYHGASTGRWASSGVQIQNLPRPQIKNTDLASEIVKDGDLEIIRMIYGEPMHTFSSCIRSVIIPSEGKEFFCADYAAIEARVLFWIAEHKDGVKAFLENRPMYEEMASVIFRREITKKDDRERTVGKQVVLGCGYGLGHKKFIEVCKKFGIEIDENLAKTAVQAYRNTHYPVPKLWANLERAAIFAVQKKGTKFKINKTTWWVENNFLWCELPSSRRLAYYAPLVKYEDTPWGEKRPKLYHYGVNNLTRKWELSSTYGGRLSENVVQAVARDLMADAMLRIEDAGYEIVLTVHDEVLAERKKGEGRIKEFCDLMAETDEWAKGCPVKVEGWSGLRYRK